MAVFGRAMDMAFSLVGRRPYGRVMPVAPSRARRLAMALEAARFGPDRTLNLRLSLPVVADALRRTESWLRERQAAGAAEVLVITGRGTGSPGGVGAIRVAAGPLFKRLTREGVVASVREHNPGAFVVELAPFRRLFEDDFRPGHPRRPPVSPEIRLDGLDDETRDELRRLAEYSLFQLGAHLDESFVADEMLRQLARLTRCLATHEVVSETRLKSLVRAALRAFEDT